MDYTNQQIEQMPAGREMDTLVATRIIGALVRPPDQWEDSFERRQDRPWEPLPHYSLRIEAAWDVVEALCDLDPDVKVWPRPFVRPVVWHCQVGELVSDGESAPLAICRAALLWHLTTVHA